MTKNDVFENYQEYAGDCKHNASIGNQFYGSFCPACECRNFSDADPNLPDGWWEQKPESLLMSR